MYIYFYVPERYKICDISYEYIISMINAHDIEYVYRHHTYDL
jgi:hypothetical protein